uniref:Predicted ATP-binding protein involved in virulence n=1 Tax=Candidatus Kentrum sp. LPFa TaxID=2126335 RepID=A0A450XTJ3_9GAMM|nr:MAG: Predicted ATP-binding protein involved in virulence [Candidatus Kentron sp. LPFa]VFK32627.1 MAG: Predicted ATP-binding protein involved in virulence [Candidatus Kentron sp. LPFa]
MNDTFITKIQVNQSRNIRDLTIPLSETERKHLIITGKNGSGKTSLLEALVRFLRQVDNKYSNCSTWLNHQKPLLDQLALIEDQPKTDETATRMARLRTDIDQCKNLIGNFGGTEISFSEFSHTVCDSAQAGNFLMAFFEAKRQTQLTVPKGIEKVPLKEKYSTNERISLAFLQYLVNLKAERSFARDDGDEEAVRAIDGWFDRFESRLKVLFQSPDLQLRFDRKNYNFEIFEEEGKLPFGFNQLSDGYSAILSIVSDLLLRMEGHGAGTHAGVYDLEGVVLIDEIETHLHVALQKEILPFLIDFFPKIQFIVTTHSPFVLSSVSNAVICDLEERIVTEDLSTYSYDAIVESYFEADKYSEEIKRKVSRYEALVAMAPISAEEAEERRRLKAYFSAAAPKYLSRELAMKLRQIESWSSGHETCD